MRLKLKFQAVIDSGARSQIHADKVDGEVLELICDVDDGFICV